MDVEKVLRSAVANAEHNNQMRADDLVVKAAYVDEGPTLKAHPSSHQGLRLPHPEARSHITVIVAPRKET